MSETAVCALEDLGVLSLRGQEVRKFLQGQLSNDVDQLAPGSLLRAGLHNPQGRTLALLALLMGGDEEVLAVLPRELAAPTLATLTRYVLRARVRIADASEAYRLYGLSVSEPGSVPPGGIDVPYDAAGGTRRLRIAPAAAVPPRGAPLPRSVWRLQDVAAGLPQLYAPTSGQFVAQMINLDCIGAISFSKGCYTGQEVVARAHYRGRVKRRMQRFFSAAAPALAAGDAGQLADGRGFRVVEAAARAAGGVEFLAVAALPGAGSGAGGEFAESTAASAPSAAGASPLEVHPLPLPYALPE